MKSKRNSTSARAQGIKYEIKLEKDLSKSEMPDSIKNFFTEDKLECKSSPEQIFRWICEENNIENMEIV